MINKQQRQSRHCNERDHQCVFYFRTDYEGSWCMLNYNDCNGEYGLMSYELKHNCPYNYSKDEVINLMNNDV